MRQTVGRPISTRLICCNLLAIITEVVYTIRVVSSKNDIITLPNSNLRQKSRRIGLVTPEILNYIDDMKTAALDWEASRSHEVGVALAAIQINRPLRLAIVREDFENKKNKNFITLINPEVVKYEGEIIEDYEGCLSIKDIYGKVPRHSRVRVKATDENGQAIKLRAEGFLARVLQHEIDHMNGVMFIDHIKDDPEAFYRLSDEGRLEELDYETEVRSSNILWQ